MATNQPRVEGARTLPEDFAPEVVCTEHVRSNVRVALEVEVAGVVIAIICLAPLWATSTILSVIRYCLLALVGAAMVMGVIQILGYFNKKIEMSKHGIVYTSSLGAKEYHAWEDVVAYDTREDLNSLELVFGAGVRGGSSASADASASSATGPDEGSNAGSRAGRPKRRTFHKTSQNYEAMVDYVIDHTELISVK
ncbi:MAG: hypothetical protein ACOX4F_02475 [Atopobiaceae bacterium]|jgi:hypothetical protein